MDKVKIGIITALPAELKSITSKKIPQGSHLEIMPGILLALSGMGPDNALLAAKKLIEQKISALISWGCAGALQLGLQPGDLLLPNAIINSDGQTLPTSSFWRKQLITLLSEHNLPEQQLPKQNLAIYSSQDLIASPTDKHQIYKKTGAAAADMESWPLAQLANQMNIPFICLRSIADTSQCQVPDCVLQASDANGQMRLSKLLICLIKQPTQLPDLIQLGKNFQKASASLSTLFRLAGPLLLASAHLLESDPLTKTHQPTREPIQ